MIEQAGLADGDEEPFEAVRRRIVCGRFGNATFVANDSDVNHAEGRYKKIGRETLISLCEDPIMHSLLFSRYVRPFHREYNTDTCLWHLQNLEQISLKLSNDALWMAKLMCGIDPDRDNQLKDDANSDDLVRAVHRATPENAWSVKPYVLSGLSCIPGLKKHTRSAKNKPTKLENFDAALAKTRYKLFEWNEESRGYDRLRINLDKLEAAMAANGGDEVFGTWATWGDTFALREEQTDVRMRLANVSLDTVFLDSWDGGGASAPAGPAGGFPVDQELRNIMNYTQLTEYMADGTDKTQDYLVRLVADLSRRGTDVTDEPELKQMLDQYYLKAHYCRLLARGLAIQKASSDTRSAAYRGHAVDVDMDDCYGRLLYNELVENNIYSDERHLMIKLSTFHHMSDVQHSSAAPPLRNLCEIAATCCTGTHKSLVISKDEKNPEHIIFHVSKHKNYWCSKKRVAAIIRTSQFKRKAKQIQDRIRHANKSPRKYFPHRRCFYLIFHATFFRDDD